MRSPTSSRCVQNRRPGVPIGRGGCVGVVGPDAQFYQPGPLVTSIEEQSDNLPRGRFRSRDVESG